MTDATAAHRSPKRLDNFDLDGMSVAVRDWRPWNTSEADWHRDLAVLARDEVPDLIEYTRWLYARRGRLVERMQLLAAVGRISVGELAEILLDAGWTEEDGSLLREAQQGPKHWW